MHWSRPQNSDHLSASLLGKTQIWPVCPDVWSWRLLLRCLQSVGFLGIHPPWLLMWSTLGLDIRTLPSFLLLGSAPFGFQPASSESMSSRSLSGQSSCESSHHLHPLPFVQPVGEWLLDSSFSFFLFFFFSLSLSLSLSRFLSVSLSALLTLPHHNTKGETREIGDTDSVSLSL